MENLELFKSELKRVQDLSKNKEFMKNLGPQLGSVILEKVKILKSIVKKLSVDVDIVEEIGKN
jgi:hypothetical protein